MEERRRLEFMRAPLAMVVYATIKRRIPGPGCSSSQRSPYAPHEYVYQPPPGAGVDQGVTVTVTPPKFVVPPRLLSSVTCDNSSDPLPGVCWSARTPAPVFFDEFESRHRRRQVAGSLAFSRFSSKSMPWPALPAVVARAMRQRQFPIRVLPDADTADQVVRASRRRSPSASSVAGALLANLEPAVATIHAVAVGTMPAIVVTRSPPPAKSSSSS